MSSPFPPPAIAALLLLSAAACAPPPGEPSGDPTPDEEPGVPLRFQSIDSGDHAVCGILEDGTGRCWGGWQPSPDADPAPIEGYPVAPAGDDLREIAVGRWDVCALRGDGTLACEGIGDWLHPPPEGEFVALDVHGQTACAVGVDGGLRCWGEWVGEAFRPPKGHHWARVAVGGQARWDEPTGCAMDRSGGLHGWGREVGYQLDVPPSGAFIDYDLDWSHGCALRGDGEITCWGSDEFEQLDAPAGPWIQAEAGGTVSCGLRPDGRIECWGAGGWEPLCEEALDVPDGVFRSISAGSCFGCGVALDGEVRCWGRADRGELTPPTED